jgi:hypothetical protein
MMRHIRRGPPIPHLVHRYGGGSARASARKCLLLILSDATTRSSVQPFPANQCAPLAPFESGASMSHLEEQDETSMASNSGGL